MLTPPDIKKILDSVSYMPGYEFELYETESQGWWIVIKFSVTDSYHPEQTQRQAVRSALPPFFGRSHFLMWLRWRLERIAVHEVHEWLRVGGKLLWDPHDEEAVMPRDHV